MLSTGDEAPSFTAPLANGDIESFTLTDRLDEAPIVLAFFPGAFTGVCTHEMNTFQDRLDDFSEAGASVYGVSIDTPFSQNEFRDKLGLEFDLLSDSNREVVDEWGLSMDFDELGVDGVAKRSVFVIDGDGVVQYAWVSDDPGVEPEYDDVLDAVEAI
ncbi:MULTISPECIES: redoxin domain-containing protein [Halomicrobium]|uniref:Alkyl hydroperoxide reductase/ Thiol specific antioxidant/ Mal allergen n=2 Tax=Halomicrobium mukohataei TaxID=57705 RepID=C7NZM1_HALMD|nr:MULTISPECIES: redoxin domain-containing protein [Halomicrobium]ACV48789.1 alkyl hydroperoxide reductase/ Thiol specific antioxidant/ Mal allergen [Halomicrobium mukohataei DSM 12286]QCD64220.1 redoxin domain-containing protein [Halomicrobium mukohataei]QFR19026.1 redoxin domain-containing protein [Halomicrobium sp. ZPS1]